MTRPDYSALGKALADALYPSPTREQHATDAGAAGRSLVYTYVQVREEFEELKTEYHKVREQRDVAWTELDDARAKLTEALDARDTASEQRDEARAELATVELNTYKARKERDAARMLRLSNLDELRRARDERDEVRAVLTEALKRDAATVDLHTYTKVRRERDEARAKLNAPRPKDLDALKEARTMRDKWRNSYAKAAQLAMDRNAEIDRLLAKLNNDDPTPRKITELQEQVTHLMKERNEHAAAMSLSDQATGRLLREVEELRATNLATYTAWARGEGSA